MARSASALRAFAMGTAAKYGMANSIQIITSALSRLGVVGANRSVTPSDQELGLQVLKDLLRRFIYAGSLGTRTTINPSGDYEARENEHIYRNSDSATSITLPEFVADAGSITNDYGDYVSGARTRTPRDGAFVIITDLLTNITIEYLYDGATKQWIDIANLDLTSLVPFSTKDNTGLAACLACELADFFGQEITPATFELRRRFLLTLTNNLSEADVSDRSRGIYY